jgi:hypothetical protein
MLLESDFLTESLPEQTAIYEIDINKIPDEERLNLIELIEKKVETKIAELQINDLFNMKNLNYSIGFVSPKYERQNDMLRVYIRALTDEEAPKEASKKTMTLDEIYRNLTSEIDRIFSDISTFRDELYPPHSVKRIKDFGTKTPRSRPAWL